ncbi:oxidoreductase [Thalassospira sp. NFXS8]|uniref:PDR/VanB family oxidoreductase n=1 Tax=Thalassospira sp. NFXS8 TaxID=2819093 RepID=UPI0032DF41A2
MQNAHLNTLATVTEASDIAKGIRRFRFKLEGDTVSLAAGAHVTFALETPNGAIERSYSVVDDGYVPDHLTISVKLERASRGGSRHMWSLQVGDTVRIIGNDNSMPVSYGGSDYVLLAGGIGVTPMTGIARALCKTGKSLRMIYCARSPEEAAYADILSDLLGARLTMIYDMAGDRLDIDTLVAGLSRSTLLYMCGPAGLMDAVKSAWSAHALPPQNLRYETFGNSGTRATRKFSVLVEETGRTVEVPEDSSLLDALLASGHDMLSDCRKGECGLCKVGVLQSDGEIDHRDVFLSPREREARDCMCACVSRLSGDGVRIRIDGIQHGRAS